MTIGPPRMRDDETKKVIKDQQLCRIAFKGKDYPCMAAFVRSSERVYFSAHPSAECFDQSLVVRLLLSKLEWKSSNAFPAVSPVLFSSWRSASRRMAVSFHLVVRFMQ